MAAMRTYPDARTRSSYFGLAAGCLLLLPAFLGVVAALLGFLPYDPLAFAGEPLEPPSARFLLGCDGLGRDMLSRLGAAASSFAVPGALAMTTALMLGALLGVVASLGGRVWGAVASWLLQVVDSVPKFVLVLLVAAIARSNLFWIMTAVGVTFAPQIADSIKQSVERLRAEAFIEAERSLGVSIWRILFVHVLWGHARYIILSQLMSLLAYSLLVETSLSYLGGELGVQEPMPSWGNMIAMARDALFAGYAGPALLPAGMIATTILGCNLVGRALVRFVEERG